MHVPSPEDHSALCGTPRLKSQTYFSNAAVVKRKSKFLSDLLDTMCDGADGTLGYYAARVVLWFPEAALGPQCIFRASFARLLPPEELGPFPSRCRSFISVAVVLAAVVAVQSSWQQCVTVRGVVGTGPGDGAVCFGSLGPAL